MAGVFIILFVAIFLVLTGRFLYIQATGEINDISLEEWATEKRTASYTLDAERGKILDKNGMTLAYDRPTYRIYGIIDEAYSENLDEPMHIVDSLETAEALAPLLDMEENEIVSQIEEGKESGLFQVEFGTSGKELSQQKKEEIEELDLPGINFQKESIRHYPNGEFLAHILGIARKSGDENVINGITGLESYMNDTLRGENGYISYERDKYNTKLLDPNEIIQQPSNGNDVYLTIDQKIQTLLEDVLSQVESEYNPERISAAVMDPQTGEILAMSNRPGFNPNNPDDVENWYNDIISTPFEPGSTMKMFTWAAAIEEGVYNGEEWFESGTYQVSDRITAIRDHNNGEGWGPITYDEGFARSSNVAAARLLWEKIDPDVYLDYLHAFDFDQKTEIDLPGEVAGSILYNWPIEKITTSFGQGTTLTPIQQMKAASAIANDGKMVKPYVISKITETNSNQVKSETEPEVVGEPISEETASEVMDLLETVVTSEKGTGSRYQLEDYTVAGKTGTAQIPNPEGPTPYLTGHDNYVFSFLGMAPKEDPRLMMYVSVKRPELDDYEAGSVPVSFIFRNVMENSLHYLNIEPDKEKVEQVNPIQIPAIVGKDAKEVEEKLTDQGIRVTLVGKGGKIVDASVEEGDELFPNDHVILVTDSPTMPNIIGWSIRDVSMLADLLQLNLETLGSGYITTQSIEPGNSLEEGDYLAVELEPPTNQDEVPLEEEEAKKDPELIEQEE